MEVIDKILNEWSFRCHDGIVDMNDPKKLVILNEILAEYNLNEQEKKSYEELSSELKDEMLNLGYDEKLKILSYIKKVKSKEEENIKNIEKELNSKQIPEDILDLIVLRSEKRDLITQLENLTNSVKTLKELGIKGQLKVNSDLMWINNLTGTQSSLSLGKGEILLAIMLENAILAKDNKYDINYRGQQIEVKQGNISGNKVYGAIISPQGRSYGYKTVWDKKVEGGKSFKNKYFEDQKTELSTWTPIFNYYNQDTTDKNQFLTDLNSAFSIISKEKIKIEDFKDPRTFYKKIAYLVTDDYLKNNKVLILMNSNLDYLILDEAGYKDAILNNPDIYTNNAFIPRIAYGQKPADEETEEVSVSIEPPQAKEKISVPKKEITAGMIDGEWFNNQNFPSEIESKFEVIKDKDNKNWYKLTDTKSTRLKITEELTNYLVELFDPTGHFKQRTNERGKVLDVLNLNEIPLKDYNTADVKEKLKSNISNEIQNRAAKILEKESIPSSFTYEVGIKVLKPILVVDGKEYSLKLFAKSITVAKDGSEVEKDNVGTLYFATVYDDRATTLLLLNKEDDNELSFQIKKHAERKPGREDKDTKILTPPNYIYRIDLDKLMGREKQGPELVDSSTLPYKVRTDYRTGAKFVHSQHGIGTIIATSAGSGGKGDSRGSIDWIDVKYPIPFAKGGKVTDTRRFDNIITLASPLLAK